jgi:hypothetical protein
MIVEECMRVRVIKQHLGEGSFPTFAKGSAVTIGEECTHFPHWYSCSIQGRETYVPESLIHAGELIRNYNPTELVAEVGDVLEVHDIVYAWLFAVNAQGVSGWIPAESVLSEGITESSTISSHTQQTALMEWNGIRGRWEALQTMPAKTFSGLPSK